MNPQRRQTRDALLNSIMVQAQLMAVTGSTDMRGIQKDFTSLSSLFQDELADYIPQMQALGHDEAAMSMKQAAEMVNSQTTLVNTMMDIISRCRYK